MKYAPIALFVYNRPEHTRKVLSSIQLNKEAKESDLYVFIDGPRNTEDKRKIKEVRNIIENNHSCRSIKIVQGHENRGCPAQMIDGITEVCNLHGRAIIIEDDDYISPFFLEYVNRGLDIYEHEDLAMSICGYMYPVGRLSMQSAFMRGCGNWGWGTWKRAWDHFQPDGKKLLDEIIRRKLAYEFNYKGTDYKLRMLKRQIKGEIQSFAIRWYASCFLRGGLTLYPGKSLVQNIGFDNSGTNTYRSTKYDTELSMQPVLEFPEKVEENEEMISATVKWLRRKNHLYIKLYERVMSVLVQGFRI